jgi:hypothetical protein
MPTLQHALRKAGTKSLPFFVTAAQKQLVRWRIDPSAHPEIIH